MARALTQTDASHIHTAPLPTTNWLFLNVRERPFDDPRVRRAFNYAIDRRHVIALAGGTGLAGLTCQVIPPGLLGYTPICPYTRDPTRAGSWSAPDLAQARRLVAASGTRGARVQVWGFPKYAAVVRYAADVLRRLGYRVRVRVPSDLNRYFDDIEDRRLRAQVGMYPWIADFLTPSSFFQPFTCNHGRRDPGDTVNVSRFCDHAFDAGYAAAARGVAGNVRWAAFERRMLAAAPAVPLFNRRMLILVSDRVGNPQAHEQIGPLLDQFWVR